MDLSLYTEPSQFSEPHAKGKHVVIIDVLRASSTIVHACENGVERIIPVAHVEDATKLLPTLDREATLLGGEREGIKIDGFDLGNSPLEYTPEVVDGKTLVFTTSNGTAAIAQSAPADEIVVGCFLNLRAVVEHLLTTRPAEVAILCSGNLGQLSLEDLVCGGHIVRSLEERLGNGLATNDGAEAARALAGCLQDVGEVVRGSTHGRKLAALGFDGDLEFCSRLDAFDTVPVVAEGRISGKIQNRR
jgi:2-phosphosulfolactate phosphatase